MPLALNFGVEFEFYTVVPTTFIDIVQQDHDDMYPDQAAVSAYSTGSDAYDDRRRQLVQDVLISGLETEAGISVSLDELGSGYSKWRLGIDGSIKLPPKRQRLQDHEYFAFELVSRVLPLNDLDYTNEDHPPQHGKKSGKGLDEVTRVLKFLSGQKRMPCEVNSSCGMHVHIGLAPVRPADGTVTKGKPGAPFKLKALQNLSVLATIFEPYVNLILNDDRAHNHYCQRPSGTKGL